MSPLRRRLLAVMGAAAAVPAAAIDDLTADRIVRGRALAFPRDHGAHPGARIEWWYATGWLEGERGALLGFQLTFFRSRTALAADLPGRYAPRQLLFAHAALTEVAAGRHFHAQRIARWSGDEALPDAHAARTDTRVALGRWTLERDAASGAYTAALPAPEAGIALALRLAPTQPLLLQGDGGFSRKGPQPQQASHYYSQPQLAVTGTVQTGGPPRSGRGWLDHEWSDELLAPGATGWDWIGINLADGGALTAFVLRRADGSVVWAGGSHRPAGAALRVFGADEVVFTPQRTWSSPATGGRYPVEWTIGTPAGRHTLRALLDAQELDSRASAGTVYWEGLAELLAPGGARIGLGYLEMTGRAQALKLG
jgi:predicted secreted hydrolase